MEANNGYRVVLFGGGNGNGQAASAFAWLFMPMQSVKSIIGVFDNGGRTLTGRLFAKGDLAHHGDVVRNLGALHRTANPHSILPEQLATRLPCIKEGQVFGDLLSKYLFSGVFGDEIRYPPGSKEKVEQMCRLLNVDNVRALRLIMDALESPMEQDEEGHALSNMLLAVFQRIASRQVSPERSLETALEGLHSFYQIRATHRVILGTYKRAVLRATTKSGRKIVGQYLIDHQAEDPCSDPQDPDPIETVKIIPSVSASEQALRAIEEANLFLFSCGSLGGNILALFEIVGIREAFQKRVKEVNVPVVYVVNMMTEQGQTRRGKVCLTAAELADRIRETIGLPDHPMHLIVDTTEIPEEVLARYLPERKIVQPGIPPGYTRSFQEGFNTFHAAPLARGAEPIHDPKKLSVLLTKIFEMEFSNVHAGTLP